MLVFNTAKVTSTSMIPISRVNLSLLLTIVFLCWLRFITLRANVKLSSYYNNFSVKNKCYRLQKPELFRISGSRSNDSK